MFKKPFSFKGRIRRTEFAISYVIWFCAIPILGIMIGQSEFDSLFIWMMIVMIGAINWFIIAQSAKRCHDMGHSGFYQLIPFYVFVLFFREGVNRTNQYGQDPKLLELRENLSSPKSKKLVLPTGKNIEDVAGELISGSLIITLAFALSTYFITPEGWESYIIEIILIMAGYYLILLFNFKNEWDPTLTRYFILHRAIFSVTFYVLITVYKIYGYNLQDVSFSNIGGYIVNITSVFLLTYIPYLIFKTKKSPKPFLLET